MQEIVTRQKEWSLGADDLAAQLAAACEACRLALSDFQSPQHEQRYDISIPALRAVLSDPPAVARAPLERVENADSELRERLSAFQGQCDASLSVLNDVRHELRAPDGFSVVEAAIDIRMARENAERERGALRGQLAQMESDWMQLLRELAKLSDVLGYDDGDWSETDDDTRSEQFDPWEVIRRATQDATALRERLAQAKGVAVTLARALSFFASTYHWQQHASTRIEHCQSDMCRGAVDALSAHEALVATLEETRDGEVDNT